jgi:hypothetical protein
LFLNGFIILGNSMPASVGAANPAPAGQYHDAGQEDIGEGSNAWKQAN